jgi:hypothetical protein
MPKSRTDSIQVPATLVTLTTEPHRLSARDWLLHRFLASAASQQDTLETELPSRWLTAAMGVSWERVKESAQALNDGPHAGWPVDRIPDDQETDEWGRLPSRRISPAPLVAIEIRDRSLVARFPIEAAGTLMLPGKHYVRVPLAAMRQAKTWAACRFYELARWHALRCGPGGKPVLWRQGGDSLAGLLGLDASSKTHMRDLRETVRRTLGDPADPTTRLPGMPDLAPATTSRSKDKDDEYRRWARLSPAQRKASISWLEQEKQEAWEDGNRTWLKELASRGPRRRRIPDPARDTRAAVLTADGGVFVRVSAAPPVAPAAGGPLLVSDTTSEILEAVDHSEFRMPSPASISAAWGWMRTRAGGTNWSQRVLLKCFSACVADALIELPEHPGLPSGQALIGLCRDTRWNFDIAFPLWVSKCPPQQPASVPAVLKRWRVHQPVIAPGLRQGEEVDWSALSDDIEPEPKEKPMPPAAPTPPSSVQAARRPLTPAQPAATMRAARAAAPPAPAPAPRPRRIEDDYDKSQRLIQESQGRLDPLLVGEAVLLHLDGRYAEAIAMLEKGN